jgi:flagellar hook-length control protein FliK
VQADGIAHASDNSAVAQLRTPAPETPPVDQVAPPPPPAEQPPAVEQVVQTVIEKVEEGGGEAHIRLDPPELGAVTIHVKITGGHVRVDVHAERSETMQMLRDQALDLTSLLNGRGLDLTDVYVGLGGRQAPDARGDDDPSNRDRQGQGDEFRNLLGIDEEPAVSDRYNRLRSAYNPDGTHVYRI